MTCRAEAIVIWGEVASLLGPHELAVYILAASRVQEFGQYPIRMILRHVGDTPKHKQAAARLVDQGVLTVSENGKITAVAAAVPQSGRQILYERKAKRPEQEKVRREISAKLRFFILNRDSFRCVYCGTGSDADVLHVDHVHPVSAGGTNAHDNLVTSCALCNLGKGARTPREWIEGDL